MRYLKLFGLRSLLGLASIIHGLLVIFTQKYLSLDKVILILHMKILEIRLGKEYMADTLGISCINLGLDLMGVDPNEEGTTEAREEDNTPGSKELG